MFLRIEVCKLGPGTRFNQILWMSSNTDTLRDGKQPNEA